jgi:hypothetical protein
LKADGCDEWRNVSKDDIIEWASLKLKVANRLDEALQTSRIQSYLQLWQQHEKIKISDLSEQTKSVSPSISNI